MTELLQLYTRRLHLRRPRSEDAAAICAYRGLPEVSKYQSWETFGVEDATNLIADQLTVKPAAMVSWLQLMINLADSGQLIGDCGIHFPSNAMQQVSWELRSIPGIRIVVPHMRRLEAC